MELHIAATGRRLAGCGSFSEEVHELTHVYHRIPKALLVTMVGVLVLALALITGQTRAFAAGDALILTLFGDRSATGSCDTTVTGNHTGVINVSVGTTCL